MCLINATTLELERFDDEARTPPYAILSHTWGDDEVTFEKANPRGFQNPHSRGAWKIQKTCEQALAEGLGYA